MTLTRCWALKLTPDLKWELVHTIDHKRLRNYCRFLNHPSMYLTSHAILYFYKSQIRPKVEYCRHIWTRVAQSPLTSLDRGQKCHRILLSDKLFFYFPPSNFSLSLTGRTTFLDSVSFNLHSYEPPCNSHCSKPATFPRCKIPLEQQLLTKYCFVEPAHYNLKMFKSRINRYLPLLST